MIILHSSDHRMSRGQVIRLFAYQGGISLEKHSVTHLLRHARRCYFGASSGLGAAGRYGGEPSESEAVHRSRNMMRPRPGASRAPDPSVSAPIAGLTYPPNPETQSTSGAEMSDGPPEAFQGGAFRVPPPGGPSSLLSTSAHLSGVPLSSLHHEPFASR